MWIFISELVDQINLESKNNKSNMARNSGSDFGGNLKNGKNLRLKSLKTRDDMSTTEDNYHTGLPATVPFLWESEPGTPKANFSPIGARFSPLTPPPSYFSAPLMPQHHNFNSKPCSSATNFINSVFRKLCVNKASLVQPPSPGSWSSSYSSATPTSAAAMSFDSRVDEDEDREDVESPVSTLFFETGSGRSGARDEGCYPKLVKVFTRDSK